jgi:nitrile hydratase
MPWSTPTDEDRPRNGARVVAEGLPTGVGGRAARDGTAAIASCGYTGRQGDEIVAVENTPAEQGRWSARCAPLSAVRVCHVWYKSPPYRSRAVFDPRGVLAEFGVTLPDSTRIRVWDSTSEARYLVIPMRPAGTDGWTEQRLADLVTRDSMIGTGLALSPEEVPA